MFHKNNLTKSTVSSIHFILTTNLSFWCSGYTWSLHRSLNFSLTDMRKAIGTSIRTANSELRKVARHRLEANNFLNDTNNEGEKGQGDETLISMKLARQRMLTAMKLKNRKMNSQTGLNTFTTAKDDRTNLSFLF